mgnify:CR=1 FL=1
MTLSNVLDKALKAAETTLQQGNQPTVIISRQALQCLVDTLRGRLLRTTQPWHADAIPLVEDEKEADTSFALNPDALTVSAFPEMSLQERKALVVDDRATTGMEQEAEAEQRRKYGGKLMSVEDILREVDEVS